MTRGRIGVYAACSVLAFIPLMGNAASDGHDCLILPTQIVELRFAVEGVIEKMQVNRGDFVNKGDVLAELESSAEKSALEIARYRASTKGAQNLSERRFQFTDKKVTRKRELAKNNFVTPLDLDEAEAERGIAEAEILQQKENTKLAELEARRAQDMLNIRAIRAPFAGVVMERLLNPGELARSGEGGKPVLKLAQIAPLRVEVVLPSSAYGSVKVGTQGEIFPEAPHGGKHSAVVTVVDRVLDAASATFGVRMELSNPKHALPGGIRCTAKFVKAGKP